jgi:hypothetical protein
MSHSRSKENLSTGTTNNNGETTHDKNLLNSDAATFVFRNKSIRESNVVGYWRPEHPPRINTLVKSELFYYCKNP